MIQKKVKNEHRKHKNGVNFEEEVRGLIDKEHHISKPQLKTYLLKVHKEELGYSEKTIDRKLHQMEKDRYLLRLDYDDYPKYGITEKNNRVVYYVSKKYLKIKEDLDKIFEYIEFDDPVAQKLAFEEIIRHDGEYLFNTHQLDILAFRLHSKDNEFVNSLVDTLCKYILERGIEPSNKDRFLEILRELLKKCKIRTLEQPNLRRHVLWLLAYYRDSTVIGQLKKDAHELEDPTIIVSEYCNEYVAPLIEENLFELFKLQIELKGKEKASDFISRIKDNECNLKNPLEALEGNAKLEGKIKGIPQGK